MEKISQLFGSYIDKVILFSFSGLDSNEVFSFFIVILA
jgi:hypothetical protein